MRNAMLLSSMLVSLLLAMALLDAWRGRGKVAFAPGDTTHGHYQIELECDACHTPFEGVKQDACLQCHGEELEQADDSHPRAKFTDPRNADRVAKLDARECISCHVEHRPEITDRFGTTLPPDYCVHCHQDIGEERASHAGLPFDGCQAAGCHNFHDNRALNEDFLARHLDEPALLAKPQLTMLLGARRRRGSRPALGAKAQDAPPEVTVPPSVVAAWAASPHARAQVNCSDCHAAPAARTEASSAEQGSPWRQRPGDEPCAGCHARARKGFVAGRHGMRLARGLSPMRPELARRPMKPEARARELGCTSCHGAHDVDRRHAAADACLGCHDDPHSLAYEGSAHARLWRAELRGEGAPGSGVSCATCHMPRLRREGRERFEVTHNQDDNLRPNEKMIRGVCDRCHGIGFALDALADAELVRGNFTGRPRGHVQSLDMIRDKLAAAQASSAP